MSDDSQTPRRPGESRRGQEMKKAAKGKELGSSSQSPSPLPLTSLPPPAFSAALSRMGDDFLLPSISTPRVLELCKNLQDDPNLPTIFVASYPKSGTTWMQCIVYNLLTKGDQSFDHISNYFPFFEISRTWDESRGSVQDRFAENHRKIGARVFNTHLRFPMMPQGDRTKHIYVLRGGKDVALSFYHHLSNQDDADNFKGSFSEFLRDWMEGRIVFGSWLKHLDSWLGRGAGDDLAGREPGDARGETDRVLIVRYEDLVSDLSSEMIRIAKFLGLALADTEVERISHFATFDYMKQHSNQFSPTSVPWKVGFEFIRQGRVGQGQAAFSAQDTLAFSNMISDFFGSETPDWLKDVPTD